MVYHYSRVLAMAARSAAAMKQALHVDDITAFDLAAKSADMRQKELLDEMRRLRVSLRGGCITRVVGNGTTHMHT